MHLLSAEETYQLIDLPRTRYIRQRVIVDAQLLMLKGRLSCLESSPPFGPNPLNSSSAGMVFKISLQEFLFPEGKLPRHWTRGLKMLRATLRVLSPPISQPNTFSSLSVSTDEEWLQRILTNVTGESPFWLLTKRTLADYCACCSSDVGETSSESAFVAGKGEGLYEACCAVCGCVNLFVSFSKGYREDVLPPMTLYGSGSTDPKPILRSPHRH